MSPSISQSISIAEYRTLVASAAKGGDGKKAARFLVKRKSPEEDLHRACMDWVSLHVVRYPILKWMMHVPNGGKRPMGEAGKLKAMGTKKGFPDLVIPFHFNGWSGFVAELKSDVGVVSQEQKEWLEMFRQDGHFVVVCRSLDEFVSAVRQFLTVAKKDDE